MMETRPSGSKQDSSSSPADCAEAAVVLAENLLRQSLAETSAAEAAQMERVANMIGHPAAKNLSLTMTDRMHRSNDSSRMARMFRRLVDRFGSSTGFSMFERLRKWFPERKWLLNGCSALFCLRWSFCSTGILSEDLPVRWSRPDAHSQEILCSVSPVDWGLIELPGHYFSSDSVHGVVRVACFFFASTTCSLVMISRFSLPHA